MASDKWFQDGSFVEVLACEFLNPVVDEYLVWLNIK